MFALVPLEQSPLRVNLKCDPLHAEVLRAYYGAVRPAWHMNKRHWNTVVVDGSIPDDEILSMIDDSHRLVLAGLPRKVRQALGG